VVVATTKSGIGVVFSGWEPGRKRAGASEMEESRSGRKIKKAEVLNLRLVLGHADFDNLSF
jgi:hypothetical protein